MVTIMVRIRVRVDIKVIRLYYGQGKFWVRVKLGLGL